jgi:hypothetical protein
MRYILAIKYRYLLEYRNVRVFEFVAVSAYHRPLVRAIIAKSINVLQRTEIETTDQKQFSAINRCLHKKTGGIGYEKPNK